jgi:hypothetical protein
MAAGVNQITGGAFQDSEGNPLAYGTLVLTLNHDGFTDNTYSTLVCAGQGIEYPLDENGNIDGAKFAWPNDQLIDVWSGAQNAAASGGAVPAGVNTTYYTAKAFTADGQLAWGPNVIRIPSSPSPFVITSVAPINPA